MAATDTRMWKLLLALGVCSLLLVKEREEGPEKLMIFIPVPRACHTVGTPGPVPAPFCQESLLSLLPLSPQPPCSEALVSSCPVPHHYKLLSLEPQQQQQIMSKVEGSG